MWKMNEDVPDCPICKEYHIDKPYLTFEMTPIFEQKIITYPTRRPIYKYVRIGFYCKKCNHVIFTESK